MCHLLINFYVQPVMFAHISIPGVLLCVKMGSMNMFIIEYFKKVLVIMFSPLYRRQCKNKK